MRAWRRQGILQDGVTLQNGANTVYEKEVCLIKEDSGAYEEKFYVSESGKERETVYIQIPQKETEEQEKPQETVSPEEERQRELKAALDAYNSRKNDPDHYYLPTKLDGKKIRVDTSGRYRRHIAGGAWLSCGSCAHGGTNQGRTEKTAETQRRSFLRIIRRW